MRPGHYIMHDIEQCLPLCCCGVGAAFAWRDYGPKCMVNTLLQVLLYAAAQLCSAFAVCCRLCGTLDEPLEGGTPR